jgi:hypothetical protein
VSLIVRVLAGQVAEDFPAQAGYMSYNGPFTGHTGVSSMTGSTAAAVQAQPTSVAGLWRPQFPLTRQQLRSFRVLKKYSATVDLQSVQVKAAPLSVAAVGGASRLAGSPCNRRARLLSAPVTVAPGIPRRLAPPGQPSPKSSADPSRRTARSDRRQPTPSARTTCWPV